VGSNPTLSARYLMSRGQNRDLSGNGETLNFADSLLRPGKVTRCGQARARRLAGNRWRVSHPPLRNESAHPPVSECGGCDSSR
jgi:hypothetical protein